MIAVACCVTRVWKPKENNSMPQVLVRDLDETVMQKLKERARQNGRSLEAELRTILQRAAGEPMTAVPPELQRVHEMFNGRTFRDSAELIRRDRDR